MKQLIALAFLSTISVASSSTNYKPLYYDRMIHFSPDGRLLQVEYAATAAENSSPLIVCQLGCCDDTMVAMTCSRSPSNSASSRHHQRPQDRLVVLEDTAVVAMSGVLADSLALLKQALNDWEDFKFVFGDQDRPSMMLTKIAESIGTACHTNCFSGGIRPYGSTMLVMGIDIDGATAGEDKRNDATEASQPFPFRIIQTDPSGGVKSIPLQSTDKQKSQQVSSSSVDLLKITGGSHDQRLKLEKAIQKLEDDPSSTMWERIRSLAAILVDAQEEMDNTASFFGLKKRKRRNKKDSTGENPTEARLNYKFEAVILSSKLGIHRLTEEQVDQLLKEVDSM
ncbi:alpha type-7-like [Seminavis robusta]|uniref:Alpha type-7-like n=1 Tax=Seminavis robusta TaxID=568900 RepID=A0A9N8F484_9STRA|nr:alpha type-7-like [Seminavis robusta]|eukprot:Sro3318_g346680.1 alpha type-7-like (339) ;mRNA; f:4801-5817